MSEGFFQIALLALIPRSTPVPGVLVRRPAGPTGYPFVSLLVVVLVPRPRNPDIESRTRTTVFTALRFATSSSGWSGGCFHSLSRQNPELVPGEHSEPRCGNVPLTRTPGTPPEDGYAPRYLAFIAESGEVPGNASTINHQLIPERQRHGFISAWGKRPRNHA